MRKYGYLTCFILLILCLFSCNKHNAVEITYKDGVVAGESGALTALSLPQSDDSSYIESEVTYYLQKSEELYDDPLFSSYYETYRAQIDGDAALIAAVLAYLDENSVDHMQDTENAYSPSTADVDEDTVYYTENGSVWHKSSTCASLSRSKNILSGTVSEAVANGKTSPCKRCSQ